jgi:hypothetical protein
MMGPRINYGLGEFMPHTQTSVVAPQRVSVNVFSDDECVQRLALLIEHRDNQNLDEIVALIARLAVPIE